MITTNKYIFDEEMFEPANYRNHKFSRIDQIVKVENLEPRTSRIIYFNKIGQIAKVEKIHKTWQSYPPGHPPPVPKIDVVDIIEYGDDHQIRSISTRSIEDSSLQLGKIDYIYREGQLIQVIKTQKFGNHNVTTISDFTFIDSKLVRVESKVSLAKDLRMHDTVEYKWKNKNKIVEKSRISRSSPGTVDELTTTTTTNYKYNANNQLLEAITLSSTGDEESIWTTKFKYLNAISNQLAVIETLERGELLSRIEYSIDDEQDFMVQKNIHRDHQEWVIEFRGYK